MKSRYLLARGLEWAGVLPLLEWAHTRRRDRFHVLGYHRVADPATWAQPWDPTLVSATPGDFAGQMRYLRRHYTPIAAADLLEALDTGRPLPPRSVWVTFDDGYRDFLTHAWPIARQVGVPLTVFVATGCVGAGEPFWWDRLARAVFTTRRRSLSWPGLGTLSLAGGERRPALRRLKGYVEWLERDQARQTVDDLIAALAPPPLDEHEPLLLTWDELRQLRGQGVTIAAHGHSHAVLTRLPPAEVGAEVRTAQAELRRELGDAPPLFCYPNGSPWAFDAGVMDAVRQAGIRIAVTLVEGANRRGALDPLALKRLAVYRDASLADFRFRFTALYNWCKAKCHFALLRSSP